MGSSAHLAFSSGFHMKFGGFHEIWISHEIWQISSGGFNEIWWIHP